MHCYRCDSFLDYLDILPPFLYIEIMSGEPNTPELKPQQKEISKIDWKSVMDKMGTEVRSGNPFLPYTEVGDKSEEYKSYSGEFNPSRDRRAFILCAPILTDGDPNNRSFVVVTEKGAKLTVPGQFKDGNGYSTGSYFIGPNDPEYRTSGWGIYDFEGKEELSVGHNGASFELTDASNEQYEAALSASNADAKKRYDEAPEQARIITDAMRKRAGLKLEP
jgi:hypothetical protein